MIHAHHPGIAYAGPGRPANRHGRGPLKGEEHSTRCLQHCSIRARRTLPPYPGLPLSPDQQGATAHPPRVQ
eukprot:365948-Chlamydomonas_euryale.AAC.13